MKNYNRIPSTVNTPSNKVSATGDAAKQIQAIWDEYVMHNHTLNPRYLVTPWFPTWKYHKEILALGLDVCRELDRFSRSQQTTLIVYSMTFDHFSEDHRESLEKAPIQLHECTFDEFIAYIQAVKLNTDISKLWDKTNEDS